MSVVFAQSSACIPVFGQKWTKSYIGVYVAGGVSDIQKQQVALALSVWYSAQQWFIDSFEGGVGTPYLFYLTDSPGEAVITVSFLIGESLSFAGRALNFVYTVPGNTFVRGDIQINLPPDRASDPNDLEVESIILHEFGHALGLGHSDIQSDAMYAIDNYPQSYRIPSTLDLNAVYMLKQSADPASLGGSICLPSQIPYGKPPWVQQNGNAYSINYPSEKFIGAINCSFTASPIVVGQIGTFQLNLNSAGDYPIRIVALSAQTDSGQTLTPSESLPQEVDPGTQQAFTFQLQGSDTDSVGTHSITFQLGFQLLMTGGWSSQTYSKTVSSNYEVTSEPAPQPVQTVGMIPTTSPDYGWLYVVFGFFVVIAIILVAIRVNEKPKKPQPEVTQAEEVEPEAKKATSQEAVVQVPKTFSPNCRVCGKPLRLLDEIEQRWYCYEDNQLYYAKDKRWVGEKTRPKKAESKTEKPTTTKNFCIECGSELPLKSKFCNNCGTKQP